VANLHVLVSDVSYIIVIFGSDVVVTVVDIAVFFKLHILSVGGDTSVWFFKVFYFADVIHYAQGIKVIIQAVVVFVV